MSISVAWSFVHAWLTTSLPPADILRPDVAPLHTEKQKTYDDGLLGRANLGDPRPSDRSSVMD